MPDLGRGNWFEVGEKFGLTGDNPIPQFHEVGAGFSALCKHASRQALLLMDMLSEDLVEQFDHPREMGISPQD